jgi:uncharacterized membrane protein YsdA (DUF1294 family)
MSMSYGRQRRDQQRLTTILGFAVPALLVAVSLCAVLRLMLHGTLYVMWLIAIGIVALVMFRLDKWQAQRSGQRVPEIVLHLLTLLGGFWGSAIGMFGFRHRHKTNDLAFWVVLAISAVLHLLIIYLWL